MVSLEIRIADFPLEWFVLPGLSPRHLLTSHTPRSILRKVRHARWQRTNLARMIDPRAEVILEQRSIGVAGVPFAVSKEDTSSLLYPCSCCFSQVRSPTLPTHPPGRPFPPVVFSLQLPFSGEGSVPGERRGTYRMEAGPLTEGGGPVNGLVAVCSGTSR